MGGFLGIGNSSAKTDRGNQLAGVQANWNVYNRGLPAYDAGVAKSTATENKAVGGLDQAKQYFSTLTAGSRPAVEAAAAPAISAITDEADAAKAEQAQMGTARGGGVAGANQQAQTNTMARTDKVIAGQQPAAAKELADVSNSEEQVSHTQLAAAMQSLGLSKEVADELINSSIQSRPISMKANAAVQQQWSTALGALGL